MMANFKKGDRVLCIRGTKELAEGCVYTIERVLEGLDSGWVIVEYWPHNHYLEDRFVLESTQASKQPDDMKPTNPKDGVGSTKLPLHLVPDTLLIYAAMAFTEGDEKYGMYNFRVAGVRASIYIDALGRHMMRFKNGEWADKVSHVPHLASAAACISILIDGFAMGNITDDRPYPLDLDAEIAKAEQVIAHVRELHKDKNPHRWTIKDAK